jgi:hypothetical protein
MRTVRSDGLQQITRSKLRVIAETHQASLPGIHEIINKGRGCVEAG